MSLTIFLLTLTNCRPKIDLTGYADTPITVSGLTAEEFTVMPKDLAGLELVTQSAVGASAKAGTVKATGPTLKTFIVNYGKAPEDFKLVRFIAKDEYRVTLHENSIQNRDVILSVYPLSEQEQPLRLLIPQAESGQWIYGITRIEFE
ncbi:MAG: hypothetical protein LBD85_06580 [Oscillospiraceae bacterium]|nr:hypothetical protein [Oscillospiraceae bacterium]